MSEKLKPCPFCGNEYVFMHTSLYGYIKEQHYYVGCGRCKCIGGHAVAEEAATALWNRRANDGKVN